MTLHLFARFCRHRDAASLALSVLASLSTGYAHADGLSIRSRFEKTFALTRAGGPVLKPGRARESHAGLAQPKPGEITIGISTTHAVGYAKLHVYNRYDKAITLRAAAMNGARLLATEPFCGHLETDSWIVLPARTSRVVVSDFAELKGDCP